MRFDFNEKYNIYKKVIIDYLKLYNIPIENSLFLVHLNKNNYPNINIVFLYNEYIHEEKKIFRIDFDNDKNGFKKYYKNINEVLEELKYLCNTFFKDFKKKSLQLTLFDL